MTWLNNVNINKDCLKKNKRQFKKDPEIVVIHNTGTINEKSVIRHLTARKVQASAHFVINEEGVVTQLLPLNIVAWHAGKSEWKGLKFLNQHSIGVELVNAGRLKKRNDKFYTYYKREIPSRNVLTHELKGVVTYWQLYKQKQLSRLVKLISDIKEVLPIKDILGHDEISPRRKIDPGKAFPWWVINNDF